MYKLEVADIKIQAKQADLLKENSYFHEENPDFWGSGQLFSPLEWVKYNFDVFPKF